jgi:hypothetical protein
MEEDRIFSGTVNYNGIFNFTELYDFIHDWCMDEQYKIIEKKYDEKILGDSKTIDIKWDCNRKISDYFLYRIKLKWTITGLKKIEVKREDKKVTMNTGSITIKFTGVIYSDYQGRWEKQPFWKFFRGFYDRYIIKSRVELYHKKLEENVNELISQTRSFLALEQRRS